MLTIDRLSSVKIEYRRPHAMNRLGHLHLIHHLLDLDPKVSSRTTEDSPQYLMSVPSLKQLNPPW